MIKHFWVKQPTPLYSFVTSLNLSSDLVPFGAVFLNGERCLENKFLNYGDYVRVIREPKRYKTPSSLVVIFQNQDFVVFDKPSGIPVPPTLDNFKENLWYLGEAQLATRLMVTHRLDTETSGLTLLAKTPSFLSFFNSQLRKKKIGKVYCAITEKETAQGLHSHFMLPVYGTPKKMTSISSPGAVACELKVLSSKLKNNFYQNEIELLTGRTHQIRAQLAHLENPIAGDVLYGGCSFSRVCLHATTLSFTDAQGRDFCFTSQPPFS